uniref:Ubiquitin-like protease family profile domain-containing protein n=1 Tax=Chenopodium quinoa TaxID=63459 RepID=A0A803NE88_CHEQI
MNAENIDPDTEVNIADDGDDFHEEPNEDLNNVISSVIESILKDTIVQEDATKDDGDNVEKDGEQPRKKASKDKPTVTKEQSKKALKDAEETLGDGDKQPVAEETFVLKNIHQEIASKININRPLKLSLISQDPSQPTPKTNEKEIPSPSTHSAKLNQAWYDWKCLCDAKEKIMTAQSIFVPICLSNHYSLVVVNLLKETIQYLDNREYDDRHKPFYKILASLVVEEMSNFLSRINHEKADEILDYEFDEVKFKWKIPKYTLDCGVFMMMHMLCFTGDPFDADLDLANRRKVYRAEICASLALAEINTERKILWKKFQG